MTDEMSRKTTETTAGVREEALRLWRALPHKGVFVLMAVSWVALFQFMGNSTFGYIETHSLFGWMYYVFTTSPDDGHCLFIPLVVLGLFWWKRQQLIEVGKREWWPALVLVVVGLALHLSGYMAQQGRVSIIGFFTGLYGLAGMVWGPKFLRTALFPYFLFIFCVPLGTVSDQLTFPLRLVVSYVSAWISEFGLGIQVVRVGTQIFDPQQTFQYDVAAACSGIRSLTVLLALTTIYGFMTFDKTWKRALMVAVALPLAVVGNVVRITGVIVTAEAFGQSAGMKFHDGAGFVTFVIAIICVVALGAWLREEEAKPIEGQPA